MPWGCGLECGGWAVLGVDMVVLAGFWRDLFWGSCANGCVRVLGRKGLNVSMRLSMSGVLRLRCASLRMTEFRLGEDGRGAVARCAMPTLAAKCAAKMGTHFLGDLVRF